MRKQQQLGKDDSKNYTPREKIRQQRVNVTTEEKKIERWSNNSEKY